ncbi:MAG: AmmeMemoRadiSam system protein B [Patescibacteria group bacterium]
MKKLVLAALSLALIASGCLPPPEEGPSIPTVTQRLPEELLLLSHLPSALATKKHYDVPVGTRLAIVPHHLVAMREIVSLLSSWPEPKPKRIFLIAPDHFSQGKTAFTSLKEDFIYLDKRVTNDALSVDSILKQVPSISLEPRILEREHSISGLIPLIDQTMPGTKIIPITIRIDTTNEELLSLVDALQSELDDKESAVIASIDMSHYLPEEFADLHDAYTIDTIQTLDAERSTSTEIDSPGSMFVILDLARRLGLGDVRIQAHTNSLRILQTLTEDIGTSHILATFSPGPIRTKRQSRSILFAPQGIPSLEDRLYYGQDEIRSALLKYPNVAISVIINIDGTRSIGIIPLIVDGNHQKIMPREQRMQLVEKWKQDGTWNAIVKELEKQL